MIIHHPGERVDDFLTDLVMEVQPRGTREHGVPRRQPDGRYYLNDQRPGSPWRSHHDDRGRWVCCYARPTDRMADVLTNVGSLEIHAWPPSEDFPLGATLLSARPGGEMQFISTYYVALEVPEYGGLRRGDRVLARWWDGRPHPAEVTAMVRERGVAYRCHFPHAKAHGQYVNVIPSDIKPPEAA